MDALSVVRRRAVGLDSSRYLVAKRIIIPYSTSAIGYIAIVISRWLQHLHHHQRVGSAVRDISHFCTVIDVEGGLATCLCYVQWCWVRSWPTLIDKTPASPVQSIIPFVVQRWRPGIICLIRWALHKRQLLRSSLCVVGVIEAYLSIATKNQPFSQGGWSGCGFLIATCGLAD